MAGVRPVGVDHVALEVGDLGAALEFYGGLFVVELRGRGSAAVGSDPWRPETRLNTSRETEPIRPIVRTYSDDPPYNRVHDNQNHFA
jgi:hypothetical protein